MPQLGLKEFVRPYYLRWLYFPLHPSLRPVGFQECWRYPSDRLGEKVRLPETDSHLPDLLFFPMTDWHTRIQRTQHLVRAFAGLGFRCIYVNPHLGREFETTPLFDKSHRLARLEHNVFELHVRLPREPVFHERLLNIGEVKIVADAVEKVLPCKRSTPGKGAGPKVRVIQILSFPLWLAVARRFRAESAFPIVYDCHDLLTGFQNIGEKLIQAESELLDDADLVLFSSQGLMDRYSGVKKGMLVRNAVTAAQFVNLASRPEGSPIAGYVGALDSWFDVEAVSQAATLNPQCRFIIAGRVEFDPIRSLGALPNVELTGEVPYDRVPELLARFRLGLIPFRVNPLTLMTNPIKLYEYFGFGLPVVSTPLPEVQAMKDLVYVGGTPSDFAHQVTKALQEDDLAQRKRRREVALRESWDSRANDISVAFAPLLRAGN